LHISAGYRLPGWRHSAASAQRAEKALFFSCDDFAAIVMTASRTDVVRALQLTAIRTFGIGFGSECMVRTAHIAFRRRSFSFWNRHGQPFLKKAAKLARKRAADLTKTAGHCKRLESPFRIA
jgi:hypothetical protein